MAGSTFTSCVLCVDIDYYCRLRICLSLHTDPLRITLSTYLVPGKSNRVVFFFVCVLSSMLCTHGYTVRTHQCVLCSIVCCLVYRLCTSLPVFCSRFVRLGLFCRVFGTGYVLLGFGFCLVSLRFGFCLVFFVCFVPFPVFPFSRDFAINTILNNICRYCNIFRGPTIP